MAVQAVQLCNRRPHASCFTLFRADKQKSPALSSSCLCNPAGDVIPSTAFDALVSQSGNILIDIRSVDEKEDYGVPLLPDMGA